MYSREGQQQRQACLKLWPHSATQWASSTHTKGRGMRGVRASSSIALCSRSGATYNTLSLPACTTHTCVVLCCVVLCCVVLCCVVLCCVVLCCVVLCPPCLVGGCCRMGCGRHGGELPFSSKGRKVQWEKSWRGERQMGRKA